MPGIQLRTTKPSRRDKSSSRSREILATTSVVGLAILLTGLALAWLQQEGETSVQNDRSVSTSPDVKTEFSLGKYQVTYGRLPESNITQPVRRLEFEAAAIVSDHEVAIDRGHLFRTHENRIHEVVETITRTTPDSDLTDPELSRVKARIREGVNRMYGRIVVDDVVLSDFRQRQF